MTEQQIKAQVIRMLVQVRSNQRRIYIALGIIVVCMAAAMLDAFWMPWETV